MKGASSAGHEGSLRNPREPADVLAFLRTVLNEPNLVAATPAAGVNLNSLVATEVEEALRKEYGVTLTATELMGLPTAGAIAEEVAKYGAGNEPAIREEAASAAAGQNDSRPRSLSPALHDSIAVVGMAVAVAPRAGESHYWAG